MKMRTEFGASFCVSEDRCVLNNIDDDVYSEYDNNFLVDVPDKDPDQLNCVVATALVK